MIDKELNKVFKDYHKFLLSKPAKDFYDYKSAYGHLRDINIKDQRSFLQILFEAAPDIVNNFDFWNAFWQQAKYMEDFNLACFYLQSLDSNELKLNKVKLAKFANRVDNWLHADYLCSVYSRLFEYDSSFKSTLISWNNSQSSWLQRMSIVSLFYYSRLRKKYPPFSLVKKMVLKNFAVKHYYLQKGIGWTLRESYNVYPSSTLRLLENVAKELSPDAWQASTEKLSAKDKSKLKKIRKGVINNAGH